MVSGVVERPALCHLPPPPTSVSCSYPLDGALLRVDGLGSSLINEMYDNVISLIE